MPATEKTGATVDRHDSRIDDDPRWRAVQRILGSQNFSKSSRLSAFLVYICRCALEDRSEEVTEQQIGIHVFNRPADYNPGDDNVVRTTARQLRQRLALYYQEEGGGDNIRIEVPKGGYHPNFVGLAEETTAALATQIEIKPKPASMSPSIAPPSEVLAARRWSSFALCLALLCGIGVALAGHSILARFRAHPAAPNPVWSGLFVSGRSTVFVAGDAGLNMYDNVARTQVSLGDYAGGLYLATPAAQSPSGYTWASLASRRYTSWVDLMLADQLRQVATATGAQYSIKFARDLHPQDLRNANIILVGAPTYNPWVDMFDRHLNFRFRYDGERNSMSVLNEKPEKGEPSEYLPAEVDPTHRGYTHGFGYIAITENLEGNGRVSLVEGSTTAGVDASLAFLMNDAKMAPILKRASEQSGIANLEILLAADFLKSSSPEAEVLATRYFITNDRSHPP